MTNPNAPAVVTATNGHRPPILPSAPADFPEECLRGLLGGYVELWRDLNYEGTAAYDFLAIMTIVGVVLGRRVYIRYANKPIFPNVYGVLIGPTNAARKSAAIDRAAELGHALDPAIIRLGPSLSAEGLISKLGGTEKDPKPPQRIIMRCEEIRSLLNKARQESMTNLIPLLTELWDCPPTYRLTTRNDPICADSPTIAILGASTPEWLGSALNDEDIYGGFGNRFLYVTGPLRAPNPWPDEPDLQQWNKLVKDLHDMQNNFPPAGTKAELSEAARHTWSGFYIDYTQRTWPSEIIEKVTQRIPQYVLKLALLYAADRGVTTIEAEDLEAAISFGEYAAQCAASLFSDVTGSKTVRLEGKVRTALEEHPPGYKRYELHRKVSGRYASRDFNNVIDAMLKTGILKTIGENIVLQGAIANER